MLYLNWNPRLFCSLCSDVDKVRLSHHLCYLSCLLCKQIEDARNRYNRNAFCFSAKLICADCFQVLCLPSMLSNGKHISYSRDTMYSSVYRVCLSWCLPLWGMQFVPYFLQFSLVLSFCPCALVLCKIDAHTNLTCAYFSTVPNNLIL